MFYLANIYMQGSVTKPRKLNRSIWVILAILNKCLVSYRYSRGWSVGRNEVFV